MDYMESGQIFSFTALSFDEKRKSGGHILSYQEAVLVSLKSSSDDKKETSEKAHKTATSKRNYHFTRKFRIMVDGVATNKIIPVHLDLLLVFNNQKVILP